MSRRFCATPFKVTFDDLQQMLIRTLAPFPDARSTVLAGLEDLSNRALQSSTAMLNPGAHPLIEAAGA